MIAGVRGFTGPYRYLSNFFIEPDGSHVEGEFQAAKAADPTKSEFIKTLTPRQAKGAGRRVVLRPDWEEVKVDIMFQLVNQKFKDSPMLRNWLKDTKSLYLEETNWWGDTFWGVCQGQGLNTLGVILMEVRDGL